MVLVEGFRNNSECERARRSSADLLPHHYFLFLGLKFLSSKDTMSDYASVSESTEDDEDENWELEYSSQHSPGDNVRRGTWHAIKYNFLLPPS